MQLQKIISGGQTGVDQAALDVALTLGFAIGGWCPPGRICDAGLIPVRFQLIETPQDASPDAPHIPRSQRTAWNVRDADATLVIISTRVPADLGTAWTQQCISQYRKAGMIADVQDPQIVRKIRDWLESGAFRILNVAGHREAFFPGIGEMTKQILREVFVPDI